MHEDVDLCCKNIFDADSAASGAASSFYSVYFSFVFTLQYNGNQLNPQSYLKIIQ